jgi:uncharacterized protein
VTSFAALQELHNLDHKIDIVYKMLFATENREDISARLQQHLSSCQDSIQAPKPPSECSKPELLVSSYTRPSKSQKRRRPRNVEIGKKIEIA